MIEIGDYIVLNRWIRGHVPVKVTKITERGSYPMIWAFYDKENEQHSNESNVTLIRKGHKYKIKSINKYIKEIR
ncbi:MAG: hypothetical protein COB41_00155 [Proteobacteria bacterium]|nr:MAG: hypothetical protein COB41_00155 [Pseudomonadota bacterium]